MPKRSERDRFDARSFETNPFAGKTPHQVYKGLRWGNAPKQTFSIEAPEPLAAMGELASFRTLSGRKDFSEHSGPYVAVGCNSNLVYLIPRKNGRPVHVPSGPKARYVRTEEVKRLDYYSDKGGEDAYYYHDHEKPYPVAYQHRQSGVVILIPRKHNGRRSYAVVPEGIVG